jgi:DNA-binding Lrp family transcriptional regulator
MNNLQQTQTEETKKSHLKSLEYTQFELTKALYTSGLFDKVDLTSSSKLFLWALCTHFNPKKETMFPSQANVAKKLGISEKSAERAVKELREKGLLTYITKKVNHYVFSAHFFELVKMSDQFRQNVGCDVRQNVGLTNKDEQRKNTKNFKNFNYAAPREPGGRAIPSIEETSKYIEEFEEAKKTSVNPYKYTKKEALRWLKMVPNWRLGRSHLVKSLVEKYQFEEFLWVLEIDEKNECEKPLQDKD